MLERAGASVNHLLLDGAELVSVDFRLWHKAALLASPMRGSTRPRQTFVSRVLRWDFALNTVKISRLEIIVIG